MSIVKISEKNRDFFEQVYAVVKLIPEGKVTSYGAIAKYLSTARASRMVGWAMNAAHGKPEIPAHRVVNRNGMLTGKMHFSSPTEMESRLKSEGLKIENDQILNFTNHFWNPSEELKL
ncbi:MAG: MGMT family protein [Lishizhenia sp.]